MSHISNLFTEQKTYFNKGLTRSFESRKQSLLKLKKIIIENEAIIHEALRLDLGKPIFESFVGETNFVVHDIDTTLKKLHKWMKPKRVKSPLLQFPVKSYIVSEPLGAVLILSPWNYPFQLLLSPLVGALAAGNTAILKPSELAPATSKCVKKLISENFDEGLVAVVEGDIPETTELLEHPFDHIFYTGNGMVAKIIMAAAAKNLTPVTLELGGKSPCVVAGNLDIDLVSKRIVWGKFFNTGQTCVAPDYILVEKKHKSNLIKGLKKYITEFYTSSPISSPDYGRIINERHFSRISGLIENETVIEGGDVDKSEKYISPTLVESSYDSPIMSDEIFGPVLPIIEIEKFTDSIDYIRKNPKPLAAYLFSSDKAYQEEFVEKVSSGGMTLNDSIVHLSSEHLPFGGVGPAGMGNYHGEFSFNCFSHKKAVMKRYLFLDISVRYPPYLGKLKLIRWIFKYLP